MSSYAILCQKWVLNLRCYLRQEKTLPCVLLCHPMSFNLFCSVAQDQFELLIKECLGLSIFDSRNFLNANLACVACGKVKFKIACDRAYMLSLGQATCPSSQIWPDNLFLGRTVITNQPFYCNLLLDLKFNGHYN